MPKSGSSYLTAILGHLPRVETVSLVPGYDRREQELDIGLLRAANNLNYVAQHHVRYSEVTHALVRHFHLRPIVQVRNLFDVVVSIRDHIRKESTISPLAYVPYEVCCWEDPKLESFIVKMMLPWYFSFYVSWLDSPEKFLVRYEDLVERPQQIIEHICQWCCLPCKQADIEIAILKTRGVFTRKNIGVPGRGQSLTDQARNLIYEMASFYKQINFSIVGL
jgi:hypothetical protein